MPAHMALFLAVVYLFAWQWVIACFIKLLRPFTNTLLRSVTVPRDLGWCLLFAFGLYFGVCFYLNYWMKLLATFAFVYYLMKVSVYECILVYKELVEEKL
jgi:hypothetical protein